MAGLAMKLVVIIPALNEEKTVADVVRRVPRVLNGVRQVEVVVIDDGSTDVTAERARAAGARVVSHPQNRGVGATFATGVQTALAMGADLVVSIDGDGQFRPEDIPQLLQPILEEQAGLVSCTRFADPRRVPAMPWVKRVGNRLMAALINRICWNSRFTDVSCGFRAYTRDTLLRLNLLGEYTYTQETFINLASQRVAIVEVPLEVRGTREHGKSRVARSVVNYAWNTGPIIVRAMRDFRPLLFFGSIAAAVIAVGVALGGFVFIRWLITGMTSPYKSLITASVAALILGFLLVVLALVADMFKRQRRLLEEMVYLLRRRHFEPERLAATDTEVVKEREQPAEHVAPLVSKTDPLSVQH
jgi:glycosyltransferase involved in cell wall biosynthesis